VIIAEQIPSKIAPDVIKNASNKIIHRIVSKDDQQLIANMVGMDDRDGVFLGDQITGRALCHTEGMRLPVSIAVKECEHKDIRINDMDLHTQARGKEGYELKILKNIIGPYFAELDEVVFKFVNTLLTRDADNIRLAVQKVKDAAKRDLAKKEPRLLCDRLYDTAIDELLSECTVKFFLSGVYCFDSLPENFIADIKAVVTEPIDEHIAKLADRLFLALGNNRLQDVICELALNYITSHHNLDNRRLVLSYFLAAPDAAVSEITAKLKQRLDSNETN